MQAADGPASTGLAEGKVVRGLVLGASEFIQEVGTCTETAQRGSVRVRPESKSAEWYASMMEI